MPIITPSNAKLLTELSEKSTAALTDIIFLYETVNSLPYKLPLSKLGIIIESGSNSNGRWIKFSDGTMIQWGEISLSTEAGSQWWSLSTLTFPTPFIDDKYSIQAISNKTDGSIPYSNSNVFVKGSTKTKSTVEIGAYKVGGATGADTSSSFPYFTIGRWK